MLTFCCHEPAFARPARGVVTARSPGRDTGWVTTPDAEQGACVFCGSQTTFGAVASSSFVPGEPNADGTSPLIRRPRVWMCDEDLSAFKRDEVVLGWCGPCFSWGQAFTSSPCGEMYMPER
jgi:hypothetical protein